MPPRALVSRDPRPLIAHLIFRFSVGGLENGLVNLINRMPPDRFRHAVICLAGFSDYVSRIQVPDIPIIDLQKSGGWDSAVYRRLWRALRDLRPAVVHSRNLGVLEGQIVAALAGTPVRIHGEHGRDTYDLRGASRKYNLFRRAVRPVVHHYTAVNRDLAAWLTGTIGIPPRQVTAIFNGVDCDRFRPPGSGREPIGPEGFAPPGTLAVGAVGRMETVKDQPTLVRAFLDLLARRPDAAARLRLVLIGDGPLCAECLRLLRDSGREHLAWLPGQRSDIPALLRGLDVFVLPSIAEGMSNTILEAMATGLPVLATRVGGNPELVEEGVTGLLCPPSGPAAMAGALAAYLDRPGLAREHGAAGRHRAERSFSLDAMVEGYCRVYETQLARAGILKGAVR